MVAIPTANEILQINKPKNKQTCLFDSFHVNRRVHCKNTQYIACMMVL